MESARVLNINRFATCLKAPPWRTGLRCYCFNLEIVGSSPGSAGRHFFFFQMHIFSVLTYAHGVLC